MTVTPVSKPINWAAIAATISAIAGVLGAVLTTTLGSQLSTAISTVLEAVSGLLVVIPTYHVSAVAKARALAGS